MKFQRRMAKGKVYIVEDGPPILVWSHQYDLHTVENPRADNQVVMVMEHEDVDKILEQQKEVFENKLGLAKQYLHQLKLKKNTKPVKHVAKKLLVSVRHKVMEILEQMIKDDVFETVEATKWLSPVFITKKVDGPL
ncbi:hypothetical protein NDU88_008923 [Pleurodeles waltl]|uniref:Reverse transcriptase domain-containing protein n=1 Tax=Pleurodeles waltl TaxID=8319 RepID=A0AAV7PQK2_PLEWA|nr:hypothetical protein NDU88_008923 [Pleurodeles waltl]